MTFTITVNGVNDEKKTQAEKYSEKITENEPDKNLSGANDR